MHPVSLCHLFFSMLMSATLLSCHSSSTSQQGGTDTGTGTVTSGEACDGFCHIVKSCQLYSDYGYNGDYSFDASACASDCRDDMNDASQEIPKCIGELKNLMTCVGDLTCDQANDWATEPMENYPCKTREDSYESCMVSNYGYYYDDYYYDYYDGYYDGYYDDWYDYYYDDVYPDPCEDYAEADRCGDWDAYWGDPVVTTVSNEFELDQLANCKCMRGSLSVSTDYLETLSLPNMEVIHGDFHIRNNDSLTTVAMQKLTSIDGELDLYGNHALESVSLPVLVGIHRLTLEDISPMTGLDGLDSLRTITATTGAAIIILNTSLENLDGLSGVTALSASIDIEENPNLTSLNGLMNITGFSSLSNEAFLILRNDALPTCSALELRDALDPQNMPICIMDNAPDTCESDYSGC
ncbi:MAG: hypothetical protein JXX14_26285 [Deltaproteobacteria bacterium]|nr:hypothetical protein [Deltaproteobacteria bacterium]